MKVLISGETGYQNLFLELGYEVTNFLPTSDGDFDLLCLTGGTDISPSLYYQKQNFYTQSPNIARDSFEIDLYNTCVRNGIPIVGICRGAQLLCALNGGKLFQHVNNHHHPHLIKLNDGREIMVSSDHHQMMDLRDLSDIHDYILLGWADHLSSFYMNEETYILKDDFPTEEPEIVLFPKTKSLCHQPHPEWMDLKSDYVSFFDDTLKMLLKPTKTKTIKRVI